MTSLNKSFLTISLKAPQERYHLNWPGKREAMLTANAPIAKTLRPCRGESVDFDTTGNLFIEGDNLEALKLLQETYLGKVKMIYIDPPYNTGSDLLYEDDFVKSADQFLKSSDQKDSDNKKLIANVESNGRFHSDWLTLMYPRLKIAKNLLSEDGIIFISIDDNENYNLRKLCEEIFGEQNRLAELVWHLSSGPQAGHFTRANESILVYAKSKNNVPFFPDTSGGTIKHGALKKISAANPASEIHFPKGSIKIEGLDKVFPSELGGSEKQYITKGTLRFVGGLLAEDVIIKAGWAMKNQVLSWLQGKPTEDSKGQKVLRFYFNAQGILFYEKERGTSHPKTVIPSSEVGGTKAGGDAIKELFGQNIMSFPKPPELIKFLMRLCTTENDFVLDFFAGSGTTAHGCFKLNALDGKNRRFILVQLDEKTSDQSLAYKEGYETISGLSKERIRRAGKQILEGNYHENWNKDVGFRVLKIDTSNMADVYYRPDEIKQADLLETVSNIKDGRDNPEDLLFQVLLDWGVDLTLPIEQKSIQGKAVYFVDKNALAACFDTGVTEQLVKEIAGHKPLRVVFKDNGFVSDAVKINVAQIFRQLSPSTEVKSL